MENFLKFLHSSSFSRKNYNQIVGDHQDGCNEEEDGHRQSKDLEALVAVEDIFHDFHVELPCGFGLYVHVETQPEDDAEGENESPNVDTYPEMEKLGLVVTIHLWSYQLICTNLKHTNLNNIRLTKFLRYSKL